MSSPALRRPRARGARARDIHSSHAPERIETPRTHPGSIARGFSGLTGARARGGIEEVLA